MKFLGVFLITAVGVLASSALFAGDLVGYWKNDKEPVWIDIQFENGTGTGTVRRNDNRHESVGRTLIKDLVSDGSESITWRGQIYARKFDEFKDAQFTLPEPDRMEIKVKVGFMSRTVSWTRAAPPPKY